MSSKELDQGEGGVADAARKHVFPILAATRLRVPSSGPALEAYRRAMLEVLKATKLVIWDLDRTFWNGVLLEDTMSYNAAHHDLVVGFARRGILSSICSHNDPAKVKEVLTARGIWPYFVFPRIGYEPKGRMVQEILANAQLRAANVVFVDDEARIRDEVMHYNHGLFATAPEYVAAIDLSSMPESDPELKRLGQYQVLEQRQIARGDLPAEDFLRMSEIVLREIEDVAPHAERIYELLQRTNQLNFTKIRMPREDFDRFLSDARFEHRCFAVSDRYGDYGVSGFSSLERGTGRLEHFVFSCRLLGMGIEQYLYDSLGRPPIEVRGEVAARLETDGLPDWIHVVTASAAPQDGDVAADAEGGASQGAVLLKGGCDLAPMAYFMRSLLRGRWRVDVEFHYRNDSGVAVVWQEHSSVVRLAIESQGGQALPEAARRIPWFDETTWATAFGRRQHGLYVLSLLMDFCCGLYRHRGDDGLVIPGEYWGIDLCDPRVDAQIFGESGIERTRQLGITPEFLGWFRDEFRFEGPISPAQLRANLLCLLDAIPPDAVLVLVNGAEVEVDRQAYPYDPRLAAHHRAMNAVLDDIVREQPRLRLVDVRRHITTIDDLADRLHHYRRSKYHALAADAVSALRALDPELRAAGTEPPA